MASHGYMSISGKSQGLISAGCSTAESIGNKCQAGHRDEVMVLSFNHTMLNLSNIDRATHQPIAIVKNIGKSTPLLAKALTNREILECKINFYRTSPMGTQERFFTVDISGCILTELTLVMPHATLENDADIQEVMALSYREIGWMHHIAGTSGYSSWDEDK